LLGAGLELMFNQLGHDLVNDLFIEAELPLDGLAEVEIEVAVCVAKFNERDVVFEQNSDLPALVPDQLKVAAAHRNFAHFETVFD